jgi:hypothetical protein
MSRLAAASATEVDMMIVVVVVDESWIAVRDWRSTKEVFDQWNLSLREGGPRSVYPWK